MTARGFDTPINYALARPAAGFSPRWGAAYKQALRDEANHKMTITSFRDAVAASRPTASTSIRT